ncbi:MAG: helix-turn-helix transcriptional regulator [Pseudomonadota bacterium]
MAIGRLTARSGGALGNRLREVRTARGLTQAELAELASVSRKTVNTVERGVFVPSVVLALKLARLLEQSVDDIFWLEPDEPDGTNGSS